MKTILLGIFLLFTSNLEQETFTISVIDSSGTSKEYTVKSSDTVLSLKDQIAKEKGGRSSYYVLTLKEVTLENGKTMSDYGVQSGSEIKVFNRRDQDAKTVG